jgi:hypothetical protein
MNPKKIAQILLTALALAGMFCALPKTSRSTDLTTQMKQSVLIADGTDPMPFCRRCK